MSTTCWREVRYSMTPWSRGQGDKVCAAGPRLCRPDLSRRDKLEAVTDPVLSPTPWTRLPGELVPALRTRLDETVDAVAAKVTGSIPAFAEIDDPKFERDIRTAVRLALERFLDLVGSTDTALPAPARESFVALGAAEARDARSTETLLAAVRLAARLLLRTASEALAGVRPVSPGELLDLSDE